MQVLYRESHEQTTQLLQVIVPETRQYQSPEAETALVYTIGDHEYHNPDNVHGTQHIRRKPGQQSQ